MKGKDVIYEYAGKSFKGYMATPIHASKLNPKAAVLIAHTWLGLDDFIKEKVHALAELGYVAFAADLFGDGKTAKDQEEAFTLILPLFKDRTLLRNTVLAGFNALNGQDEVLKSSIGAIGFCFGGLTVIELLRSGADVKGIVSFHGVLGSNLAGHKATLGKVEKMTGAALILHGNDDPSVSEQDVKDTKNEFTKAGIDWEFDIYGHTMHSFTNPNANSPESGLQFNAKANARSWIRMKNFFEEIFSKQGNKS